MVNSVTTTRFDLDVVLCRKRGKNLENIRKVMEKLINEEKLPRKHLDHGLVGSYVNRRECHIEPDWLLDLMAGAAAIFALYFKNNITFCINTLRDNFKRFYIQRKGDLTHDLRDILI